MNDQTHNPAEFIDYEAPVWCQEIASGLSVRSQFIITGNVRDVYPVPEIGNVQFVPFEDAAERVLSEQGCAAVLIHDPVDGLRLHPGAAPGVEDQLNALGIPLGSVAGTPSQLADIACQVMLEPSLPMALLIDYASPMLRRAGSELDLMLIAIDKASRLPAPERPGDCGPCPPRNPLIWLTDRSGDLPDWFVTRNPGVRDLIIGGPDLSDRIRFLNCVVQDLKGYDPAAPDKTQLAIEQFAVRCEGMTLLDAYGVIELARAEQVGLADLGEALRSYRLGTTRNPWISPQLRRRVRQALGVLENRVKGQPRALERTHDILVRAIMGLSGAQTTNRAARPRGVLFFVGPTGVGKTEMAKAVAEVMFGDEAAINRFDMSEFMSEASIARLTGAPPGAPGHEAGGELVNTVRARPFGVFLFDEIEKAHPRVLDMFLQILDDGRLSDSRGETGYFSEALIIFTSNVGMVGGDRSMNAGQNILPSDTADTLESKLTHAVSNHFRFELKRPELMNRLGRNIVPFQFISLSNSRVIFDSIIRRVIAAVHEEHGAAVTLSDSAYKELFDLCTVELNDGGRGIGNRVEDSFINPLARLLFNKGASPEIEITGVRQSGGSTELLTSD